MKKKLCLLLIFLINMIEAQSQLQINEQTKTSLAVSEKKMFDCLANGNKEEFARITGSDYITINADGTYMNKNEAIRHVENFKGSTYKIRQQETRFYNDIAITTGRVTFYVKSILVADVYFTQTWVFRDNNWLFIGWQGTMTGAPKNYPFYVALLVAFLLFSFVSLIRSRIRKRKKRAATYK